MQKQTIVNTWKIIYLNHSSNTITEIMLTFLRSLHALAVPILIIRIIFVSTVAIKYKIRLNHSLALILLHAHF